ncbi:branched-chain amino acid ABC transporter permease [Ochrobactrum teleogrylli]
MNALKPLIALPQLAETTQQESCRNQYRKYAIASLLIVMAIVPLILGNRFIFHVASMVAIMGTMALGMNLMLRLGQLSIAQAPFAGIGAYSSALLTTRAGFDGLSAFLISGLGAGTMALIIGPIFLRVKGVYFVLLTFAFAQVVNLIFQHETDLFGGNNGFYGIPKFEFLGARMGTPTSMYVGALVLLSLALLVVGYIKRSFIGEVIASLNENEDLCRSLGIDAMAWRVFIFAISAAIAAFGGSFYAHFIGFLSPDAFKFGLAVDLLVINTVGGVASVLGPVVGAVLLVPLPELLRGASQYQMLGYGVTLIAFMMFFRTGITGLLFRKS